jgi:hypothetical protein
MIVVVQSSQDMWHLIKSGRHLGYHDSEIQGSTPFHPRYVRCEGAFGCRPMVIAQGHMKRWLEEEERELPVGESPKGSGPLALKDAWRLIKSGFHLGYCIHPSMIREMRRRLWVWAHGHSARVVWSIANEVIMQGQGCSMEK